MLKIKPGQEIPKHSYSRKKITFICSCGREKEITWKNYKNNNTKSCGLCRSDKYQLDNIKGKKFDKLQLITNQQFPSRIQKRTKLKWQCDCGNTKTIAVGSVVGQLTRSCGCLSKNGHKYIKPKLISKNIWLKRIPELIDDHLPNSWSHKSGKKFKFKCKCGNIYERRFLKWNKKSKCGKCDYKHFSELYGNKWGSLTFIDDRNISIHIGSEQKVLFKCDCGNIKKIKLGAVSRGFTTSCNECNKYQPEWWNGRKFGRLTAGNVNRPIKKYSSEFIECKCTCGNVIKLKANDLSRRKTCGQCYIKGYMWWRDKPSPIYAGTKSIPNKYSLQYLSEYFDGSFLKPLNGVNNALEKIQFKCLLCGTNFASCLSWVWHSKITSCGCLHHGSSKNQEIGTWLQSLGFNVLFGDNEYIVDNYKLDLYIPNYKVGIEYHGLIWHSDKFKDTRATQLAKFKTCNDNNIDLLVIYGDEWKHKNSIFKNIILNKLKFNKPKFALRPRQCTIKLVSNKAVLEIYNKFHYIGACNSTYNIGIHYNNILIASISIKHPSRQKSGDYEISRMVCNYDYRVHGLWSYVLRWIRENDLISGKLITFSDNRISNGEVYSKMGMEKDGTVRPDYYWVKNGRRYHKSSLRKNQHEKKLNKTETELRHKQGYHKIWDYGKIKWSTTI